MTNKEIRSTQDSINRAYDEAFQDAVFWMMESRKRISWLQSMGYRDYKDLGKEISAEPDE